MKKNKSHLLQIRITEQQSNNIETAYKLYLQYNQLITLSEYIRQAIEHGTAALSETSNQDAASATRKAKAL